MMMLELDGNGIITYRDITLAIHVKLHFVTGRPFPAQGLLLLPHSPPTPCRNTKEKTKTPEVSGC